MLRRPNFHSLRGRLFLALVLTAAIPTGILLMGGSFALQQLLVVSGSAGPWDEVAGSGRSLLDHLDEIPDLGPEARALADQHRAQLSEGVRLARIYSLLGERLFALVPLAAGFLFVIAALASMLSAKRVSRSLSSPVNELVDWTESLGRGEPLPPPNLGQEAREIREVVRLRGALRHLERTLGEARRRELREARNKSWSEMARRIAHDLRNPLTPMQMAAQTVALSPEPMTAEAGQVLLEEIARLEQLSRSFAQFGRPPEGPPSAVDLRELLTHLLPRMDPTGNDIAIHLPDQPVWVEGHPVALERVVQNLIANAQDAVAMTAVTEVGASDPGLPRVEIRLGTRPHPASRHLQARIEVLDRGPGLPAGQEDRIWEADFTTKRTGTGLGLPLVAQVMEAHRGGVEAENREGGGAAFRVFLPLLEGIAE